MTERTVINIDDVPLNDRGHGKQFAVKWGRVGPLIGLNIVDYPDSNKIAVAAGVKNADFKTASYTGLGRLVPADYYDGEDG
jgi:hypothetical protein